MLIERALGHDLSGKAKMEFLSKACGQPFGRRCGTGRRTRFRTCRFGMMPPELAGKRVLVVEDEMLVALLVEDMLADAGCVVVGPFARVSGGARRRQDRSRRCRAA